MKKVLLTFVAVMALFVSYPALAATEQIDSFDANYVLNKDGSIKVSEKITYNFANLQKHGIYRYIPYKYNMDDGSTKYINISDVVVKDESNARYNFEKYTEGSNTVLKIGDAERYVTGVKVYSISYLVKGGLTYLDSGDEFFWNVNGNGWNVPIQKISATVNTYEAIEKSEIKTICFMGIYGTKDKCAKSEIASSENTDKTAKITFYDQELAVSGGLTVDVSFPKGTFEVLDAGFLGSGVSTATIAFLSLIALAIPALTFLFMLRHWWKYGRDPKGRGNIVTMYNAPDNLTPIEVGTIPDARVDMKDLSAEIISLAVRGYIKIEKIEKKGVFGKDDYLLKKLKEQTGLSAFDGELLAGIFGGVSEKKISELKNDFYTHVATIKSQVHDSLTEKKYFKERVSTTVIKYIAIGAGVGILGFGISFFLGIFTGGVATFIFAPAFIVAALIIAGFGLAMPARTADGVRAKEEILGLKEYMRVAESDRIKFHNAPEKNPAKFEELLPYAMVLGVEKEWAKQFEDIYKGSPSWYSDPAGGRFMPIVFVNDMSDFSRVATTNMFTAPQSSSGGGFGGGGFSGGGFGGGGGGSW